MANQPTHNGEARPENKAAREAEELFASKGLPLPALPPELLRDFRNLSPWVYGTRAAPRSLYDLESYVLEVEERSVADYVLLGHAGYGVNSWALHLYLVYGRLALFLQAPWGGAYMDEDDTRRKIAEKFQQVEALEQATQAAPRDGPRLIVVSTEFQLSRWRWLEAQAGQEGTSEWVDAYDALSEAIGLFEAEGTNS